MHTTTQRTKSLQAHSQCASHGCALGALVKSAQEGEERCRAETLKRVRGQLCGGVEKTAPRRTRAEEESGTASNPRTCWCAQKQLRGKADEQAVRASCVSSRRARARLPASHSSRSKVSMLITRRGAQRSRSTELGPASSTSMRCKLQLLESRTLTWGVFRAAHLRVNWSSSSPAAQIRSDFLCTSNPHFEAGAPSATPTPLMRAARARG